MRQRYYYPEHEAAYLRIEREGLATWGDLHGGAGFDDFASRDFLERALDVLDLAPAQTRVLEYGCGTGPAACFLAGRGYAVDAIDLIPRAIRLARRFARARGLTVNFRVQDICALADAPPRKHYGLIMDSYCLQSIVLDEDRARLFAAVRNRLTPNGHYLIATAMFEPDRSYDGARYEEETGVVYTPLGGEAGAAPDVDGAVLIGSSWYLPHRRHLKPAALAQELEGAGFRVLHQGGPFGGDVICREDRLHAP
jgi:SAM-dependent methyltransferase